MLRTIGFAAAAAACVACGDSATGDPTGSGGDGSTSTSTATSSDGGGGAAPLVPVSGLRAEYFASYLDRVLERIEPGLDQDFGDLGPTPEVGADHFSARWTGFLTAPESGTYQLITDADDGVRVWLDDQLVIDDWHGHFVTRNEATVELTAGVATPLRVEYFELDLAASARLSWSSATIAEEVVPTARLTTLDQPSGLLGPKPPFTNPVIPFDCPDPGVVELGGLPEPTYAAVCTGGTFPIRTSRGLVSWQDAGVSVLPDGKPPWAANGFRNWAPELHRVGGGLVAYFTTVDASDVLAIGTASAASIAGPWSVSAGPLVQHPQGVLDATQFQDDDGTRWLFYKIDGNAFGQPTPIFARQLTADGLAFASGSTATQVLVNDPNSWEGGVVEAPWVVKRSGTYYLFYSGNVYDFRYRTGVARAASLLGPYEKHGAPILGNNERWVGPGHGSVVQAGGRDFFVYHAWSNAGNGTNLAGPGRQVLVDRIDWIDGWPAIADGTPSRVEQPWPGTD